jgi:hypothetical protein
MADFFTRVELHDADSDDYETLHAAMRDRGFSQAIIGHDGKTKRILPTAEYHKTSDESCIAVRNQAHEAAETTGLKHIVLTVKAEEWAGHFDKS